jgi:hypothetical protein
MNQHELKLKFADMLLRLNNEPFKAAFAILPDDAGMALQVARSWFDDPVVVAEKERLMSGSGAAVFLATKEKQLADIYKLATNEKECAEDRIKAHRLYAEISGFIEKPSANGAVNILNQGVMIVKEHGSNDDWEAKTIEQQRTLTGHASVN